MTAAQAAEAIALLQQYLAEHGVSLTKPTVSGRCLCPACQRARKLLGKAKP